jgi:hypothetical protein
MADEKKVLYAYTVIRNEDGSVDVKDAGMEGVNEIAVPNIYKDIKEVAELVKLKEASDTAFTSAYNAVARFFQDMENARQAAAKKAAESTDKTKQ